MAENIENERLDDDITQEEAAANAAEETAADKKEPAFVEGETAAAGQRNILEDIIDIVESTLITIFVIVLIFTYLLHPVNVVGHSMENTLFDSDRIFMSTVYTGISYGDIVIINNDAAYLLDENNNVVKKDITNSRLNECIIKRVIAEPGQTINIDPATGEVTVNGKVLDEPYIKDITRGTGVFDFPVTVPEGYYFVMGDNRNNSSDSRDGDVGFIKKDQIYGKAVIRYSPLKDLKLLIYKD